MTSMRFLDLSANQLSGTLPVSLEEIRNSIGDLNLGRNNFEPSDLTGKAAVPPHPTLCSPFVTIWYGCNAPNVPDLVSVDAMLTHSPGSREALRYSGRQHLSRWWSMRRENLRMRRRCVGNVLRSD